MPAVAALLALALASAARACTTVVFAPGATADGAAYTTGTADCLDCDFRLAYVGAAAHGKGEKRAVYEYKANYPHVVREERGEVWKAGKLEGTGAQVSAWVDGKAGRGIGEVPEVRETYALIETGAGYALLNEKMVAIGESTCIARFASLPVSDGGKALLDVSELSKIALERSATAKAVVQMIGGLAEEFGYYGAEWDKPSRFDEAGEALMVSDKEESWVFHVLPDDTGTSAIWAAQRVPDGEVAVVANQFLIREVRECDGKWFLCSENLKRIAVEHGLHDDSVHGKYVDFARVYGGVRRHSSYTTHRVYRVLTLVNPGLVGKLDPYPSAMMDGYPFSVKPERKLTVEDVFRIYRDHYEGTPWDMTKSEPAQPFGDPSRYDLGPLGNFSAKQIGKAGEFGRAISIGRTSYAAVARSTAKLPEEVGAMVYFSQQQPGSSVFVPVYLAAEEVPREFTVGNLFKFHEGSMFWAVTAVSNWVASYYLYALPDLRTVQAQFERNFAVDYMDSKAAELVKAGHTSDAAALLSKFSATAAATAHKTYTKLLPRLIARFHDGFIMEDAGAVEVKMTPMFYSLDWLSKAGYYSMSETGGGDAAAAPVGVARKTPGHAVLVSSAERDLQSQKYAPGAVADEALRSTVPSKKAVIGIGAVLVFASGLSVGVAATLIGVYATGLARRHKRREGYADIA
jgi:dipeptidase